MDKYERIMVRRCSITIMEHLSNAFEAVAELKEMLDNINVKTAVPNLTKLKQEIGTLRYDAYVSYLSGDYDKVRDKESFGFATMPPKED